MLLSRLTLISLGHQLADNSSRRLCSLPLQGKQCCCSSFSILVGGKLSALCWRTRLLPLLHVLRKQCWAPGPVEVALCCIKPPTIGWLVDMPLFQPSQGDWACPLSACISVCCCADRCYLFPLVIASCVFLGEGSRGEEALQPSHPSRRLILTKSCWTLVGITCQNQCWLQN